MTRNRDRHRVGRARARDGSSCGGPADAGRNFGVGFDAAVRDRLQIAPHPHLKSRRPDVQRKIELRLFAFEVSRERFDPPCEVGMVRRGHGRDRGVAVLVAKRGGDLFDVLAESYEADPAVGRADQNPADRRLERGVRDRDPRALAAILGGGHPEDESRPARRRGSGIRSRHRRGPRQSASLRAGPL